MKTIPFRVGIQQRVLPNYRVNFFDMLAAACPKGLSVFAGTPRKQEAIESAVALQVAQSARAHNIHLFNGKFYFCFQTGFTRWLETWQPEVLIVEANPRYLSTPAGINWMKKRNRPVIGWGLGAPEIEGGFSSHRKTARTNLLKSMNAVLTYSKQGAMEYQQLGIPRQKIFVAPNAVAPKPQKPPINRPPLFKDGKPIILYIGRLQARKRIDLLIHACASLPSEIQPLLWIVGDGPAKEELESFATQLFPSTLFWGSKHGEDLQPLLDQADIFVLPGTGGLAIQQAMANALPVIVAEGDGTQSELVHPENGWVLPPDDLPALIFTLDTALRDPQHLREMGLASYKIVAEQVNLEQMVSAFERAIQFAGKDIKQEI